MREGLESHGGSHDSLIQGILSCYSEMKVKVFGIKYNKSQMGDPLFLKKIFGFLDFVLGFHLLISAEHKFQQSQPASYMTSVDLLDFWISFGL